MAYIFYDVTAMGEGAIMYVGIRVIQFHQLVPDSLVVLNERTERQMRLLRPFSTSLHFFVLVAGEF